MDLRRLMVELEQLYFRDYANFWSEAVGRLGLLPFNDAGEGRRPGFRAARRQLADPPVVAGGP